MLTTSFWVLP